MTTKYDEILSLLDHIDPIKYGNSRNYVNGAVTKLSPYVSRGVISVKTIFDHIIAKGYHKNEIKSFVQQLAWREYFQHVWLEKIIDIEIKNIQDRTVHKLIPKSIVEHKTKINAIDQSIENLYNTGYMHNHVRMYVASIVCNVGQSNWKKPAQWMYYHLLDADWASNACSWQWVSGAFSSKKYYANQENISKYTNDNQKNGFLNNSYDEIADMDIPNILIETIDLNLSTLLPENKIVKIDNSKPTLLYNFYNLDPNWRKDEDVNRILILEPSHFEKYPVSGKSIQFMLDLSDNIDNIQVYVGELSDLKSTYKISNIISKEHETLLNSGFEICLL